MLFGQIRCLALLFPPNSSQWDGWNRYLFQNLPILLFPQNCSLLWSESTKLRYLLFFTWGWSVCAKMFQSVVNGNPLSTNFLKWSDTLKQFVGKFPTNCLSVFDHFVGLSFRGLTLSKFFPLSLFFFLLTLS